MAEAEERQNMETVASDNGLNEANLGIHCDDDVVIEPTKAESVENLVDSLNLESCCIDSNTNETESDSEFDSDESEVTDEEESDEELSEGDGEAFVRLEPWTCERRHSGDGEEQPEKTTESKLDDDEDKQNPAYIPRKGSFFEHDLRLDDDGVEVETDAKLIKKKLWYDRVKWQHDKFDERSQAPKSRDEIVQIYGFDIREENRVPLDATRRSVKKRTNKKGRGKRLGDYIVFAKPVPVSLERVKRPVEGMRQFCPRRSWPENNLRRKNVIMKSLSPETVSRSKYVGEDKNKNFAGSNDPPATQRTTAGYDEIPPCFVQKVEAASAERSAHNDSRRFPENRNPTKFEPADGKLVFRSIRGNKTGRIGTGRIIGKGGPREFQPERYNPRHDKQALENPNRPAKKHFSTKRTSGMDRGAGLHTMRTIRNSGTCGHTETIETFKDAVADNDGQSTQRIMSSALTKSQDVRLLETQDGQHPTVSRISGGSGHDAARNEKSNRGYSKASGRKSTTTIHTTMAPEMIPPVTRIPTYTRSVETRSVRGRPVAHEASLSSDTPSESVSSGTETTPSFGWTGGEFIPSEQLLPRSDASGRPKRYSSQRQKVGTESGLPESANLNDGGTLASVVTMPGTAGFTTSLPQRPLPAATYYGSAPGAHGVPVFPHPSVLPLGMSSIAYTVPVSTNVAPGHIRLYNGPAIRGNPVAMATTAAPPLMHAPYLNPPGMLQGPYIGPPPVINYGPPLAHQYPVSTGSIPVQFTAGTPRPVKNQRPDGNPLEVRGGTVYFNPEIQQADMLHGMVYFNAERQAGNVRSPVRRAKVAIPIVKPEDVSAIEVIECAEPGEAAIQQKEIKEGVEQGRVEEKQVVGEVLQEEEEEVPQEEFRQQERYECPESKDEDKDNSCLSVECSHLPAGDENSVTEPGAEEEEEKVPENSTGDGKENEFSKENGSENTSE